MHNNTERVNEYIEIDKDLATKLVHAYSPDYNVSRITKFTQGKSTSNYKVEISNKDLILVLKIYPTSKTVGNKVTAIFNRVKNNLPIPKVYFINTEKILINNAYLLMEYIDGITLDNYITVNNHFPTSLAEDIGEKLALLHSTEYQREGLLDDNLNITNGLPPILNWYNCFLCNKAGQRLKPSLKKQICNYIDTHKDLLMQMTERFVFTHGDFRPANLMIKDDKLVGIIDWEFTMSAPCYLDIGQFIRDDRYLFSDTKESFARGYNRQSKRHLPVNWEVLARIMDIATMLSFINDNKEKTILYKNMINFIENTIEILR